MTRHLPLLLLLTACTDKATDPPEDTDDTELVDTDPVDTDPVDTEPVDTEPVDTEDSDATPTYAAVPGAVCPISERIGRIELFTYGGPLYLSGRLHDRPNPWHGAPERSTATCDFHRFDPGVCAPCDPNEVCGAGGVCVPAQRTVKQLTLTLTSDGQSATYDADSVTGDIAGEVTIGDVTDLFAIDIEGDGFLITLPAMPVGDGAVSATVRVSGNDVAPGALTATWPPLADDSQVATLIPINHHAAGPTFTSCIAPATAGTFSADAEMINPLAVITGLEFQGLDHVYTAAAETPLGCVEFWFGTRVYAFVEFP